MLSICWHLMVFTLLWWSSFHRKKRAKELFLVFWLILSTSTDLCQWGRPAISVGVSHHYWFVFRVLLLTGLRVSSQIKWILPKKLLLNKSTNPFPINLLSPISMVSGKEGRLKYLWTLNNVAFEKSEHTRANASDTQEFGKVFHRVRLRGVAKPSSGPNGKVGNVNKN